MNYVNTVDGNYFTLNGIRYAKIYQPLVQGDNNIALHNVYDTKQQILNTTNFADFEVNGSTYNSQQELVAALIPVILTWNEGTIILSGDTGGGGAEFTAGNGIYINEADPENPVISTDRVNFLEFVTNTTNRDKITSHNNSQDEAAMTDYLDDAVTYCKANDVAMLYFPSGLYRFDTTTIDNLDDFWFVGDGAIIKYDNSEDATWSFTNCNRVNISGFFFSTDFGSYADVAFLKIGDNSGSFNIHNNTFNNFRRTAILVEDLTGGASSEGVNIYANYFRSSNDYDNVLQTAITFLNDGEYSKVTNNFFKDVPSAVRFANGANGLFAFNILLGMDARGYTATYESGLVYCDADGTNAGKIDILYNKINHTATGISAIVCKGNSGLEYNGYRIIGNDILVHGDATNSNAIYVEDANNSVIRDNKLRGFTSSPNSSGLILNDSPQCIVDGNLIISYATGIELTGGSTNIKLGTNTIEDVTNQFTLTTSDSFASNDTLSISIGDLTTDITAGGNKEYFHVPYNCYITDIVATAFEAPTGSEINIDVLKNGSTVFSTNLTIDVTETTSSTASTPAVFSERKWDKGDVVTIAFDAVGSTTAGKGIRLQFNTAKY